MTSPDDDFGAVVRTIVAGIPPGTCASYGEIAEEAGRPGAARAVGTILKRSQGLPWWRVIRADGTLPKAADQAGRLQAEGVVVTGGPDRWRVRPG